MKTDLIKIASFSGIERPSEIYRYALLDAVIQVGEGVRELSCSNCLADHCTRQPAEREPPLRLAITSLR
jgi:hypothetical protein